MKQADEMRELLARCKSSGQSLMAFGKAEGVSYSKLLYWRRKLEEGVAKRKPSAKVSGAEFVPVSVVDETRRAGTLESKFEVWLANGVSLDVMPGFDENELRRLVGLLQSC